LKILKNIFIKINLFFFF
jgi:hypothetical protein